MQGVLTPAIEIWNFKSPRGLPSPHFESVNVIFTLFQKWGCDRKGKDHKWWSYETNNKSERPSQRKRNEHKKERTITNEKQEWTLIKKDHEEGKA